MQFLQAGLGVDKEIYSQCMKCACPLNQNLTIARNLLFIFGPAGSSLPCGLFLGCSEQGCSLPMVCRLLAEVPFLIAEHRALVQELLRSGLAAAQHSDRGSNLCPHIGRQIDSLPLSHKGSPE